MSMAFAELPIPGLALNRGIPIPPVDNVIAPSGTLIYLDPTHPASPWAPGVPVASVPNLAAPQAAALLGVGEANVAVNFVNGILPDEGRMDRTGKGALFGTTSRTKSVQAHTAQLLMTNTLAQYILARKTDLWYMSMSLYVARIGNTGAGQPLARIGQNSTTGYIAGIFESNNGTAVQGSPTTIVDKTTSSSPGLMRISIAASGTSAVTSIMQWFANWGPLAANAVGKATDWAMYNFILENTSISGRSFSQLEGVMAQKHQDLFAVNGRYANDTMPALVA